MGNRQCPQECYGTKWNHQEDAKSACQHNLQWHGDLLKNCSRAAMLPPLRSVDLFCCDQDSLDKFPERLEQCNRVKNTLASQRLTPSKDLSQEQVQKWCDFYDCK
jgi:hypothetical protein